MVRGSIVSAEPQGDEMILTFSERVKPDDSDSVLRGFSLAGEDGKYHRAHDRAQAFDGPWFKAPNIIHVWSPLVAKPVAVRYAWATSPMGNLKVGGHPDLPLPGFRTDDWDWPESDDPEVSAVGREESKEMKEDAETRLSHRLTEEAKRALEILERLKTLGTPGE